MAKSPIFVGSATAVITPYLENGIDYDKLAELIEFQYAGGTAAIIVCGTTGENATQSQAEHDKLIEFCCEKSAGRMKIVAGIGSNNTEHALENARQAKAAGADGLLMITPYYNKTTQKGLIEHFFYVADRVDVPMIVYNVPGRTAIGIKPDTYKALSKHPNINGIKEASGNLGEYGLVRAMCGDDLVFWSGNDSDTVAMMALGAKGVISVASNLIPAEIAKLCRLCMDGDFRAASEYYFTLADFCDKIFIETNPIPIKTAMNLAGMNVGKLRLPLVEMAPANLEKLKESMKGLGLEVK
ncbi:MAG: 4-hydroxy-tetrahydrodipicolinate synthase [Clostridia bacterium]|nr:4-hydroxy-tetrahydrodipicolinate synthase [Clostridia bacterium]